jgi:hypothetical protein
VRQAEDGKTRRTRRTTAKGDSGGGSSGAFRRAARFDVAEVAFSPEGVD